MANITTQMDPTLQIAHLSGLHEDCPYFAISFLPKPTFIDIDYASTSRSKTVYHIGIISSYNLFLQEQVSHGGNIFAIITKRNCQIRITLLKCSNWESSQNLCGDFFTKISGVSYNYYSPQIVEKIQAVYKRNFPSDEIDKPLYSFKQLPAATMPENAENCNPEITERIRESIRRPYNERYGLMTADCIHLNAALNARRMMLEGIGDTQMSKKTYEMPVVNRVIINNPGVIVFWSDGTKTISKCMEKDAFNPEIGLSMAISKKYYELLGFPNPRGAFKHQLKNADDQSKKTVEKKALKTKNKV